MSIGLDDVKKNRAHKKAKVASRADAVVKAPTAKQQRADAAINEEWSSHHAAPLFWVDPEENLWLAKLNDQLSRIENKVQTSVIKPLRRFRKFIRV